MTPEVIGLCIMLAAQILGVGIVVGVMQTNQRHTAKRLDEVKAEIKDIKDDQSKHAEDVVKLRETVAVHSHVLGLSPHKEFQLHQ